MPDIKIQTRGCILTGKEKGWYIFIEPTNSKQKNSFLVLYESSDGKEGYDDWVEDYEALQQYFLESNLKINWLS